MSIRICIVTAIILLIALKPLHSMPADSLRFDLYSPDSNLIANNVNKQLNVYNFNGFLKLHNLFNRFFLISDLSYARTYLQALNPATKENQSMSVKAGYNLSENTSFGGLFLYNKYTDSRKITLNFASQQAAELFGRYDFTDQIYSAFSAGFESNKQLGQNDEGLRWEGEAVFRNYQFLESNINAILIIRQEQISPRFNSIRRFQGNLNKPFDDGIEDNFSFQYEYQRNDFYFPADEWVLDQYNVSYNIQNRTEEMYSIMNNLRQIPLFTKSLLGQIKIGISQRQIERNFRYMPLNISSSLAYPDEIGETKFESQAGLMWLSANHKTNISISFQQRDEKHTILNRTGFSEREYQDRSEVEKEKNNSAKRINLYLQSNFWFGSKDILELTLSHNKLQYDTPSSSNYDDRDELLSIARIEYRRQFSELFRAYLRLEGSRNELVYIYSQKSANNMINNVIKFAGSSTYAGKNVNSTNYFEVSSNYTVYSFEDLIENMKSYSYRQYYLNDSTAIRFSGTFSLSGQTSYKFSEQGILSWSQFKTAPIRNTEEIYCHPQFITKLFDSEFAVGYRVFIVNTYNYRGSKRILETIFKSRGPSTSFSVFLGTKLRINFNGWVENITNTAGMGYQQSNFQFDLLYKM